MNAIRSGKGMLVGMLDNRTGTFQIKDGKKKWLIPVPTEGLTITTIKGEESPEQTHIPHRSRDA